MKNLTKYRDESDEEKQDECQKKPWQPEYLPEMVIDGQKNGRGKKEKKGFGENFTNLGLKMGSILF